MDERQVLSRTVGAFRVPEKLVSVGVGYDNQLVVVSSDADPDKTFAGRDQTAGSASFPHSEAKESYSINIEQLDDEGGSHKRRVDGVPVAHPFIQPTPNGGLLIVGARSRFVDGEGEHNAWIVDADGQFKSSFCAGDGIQHVQVTRSGRIWIGYFDEGVFGNFGWGDLDSPAPLGHAGLVCWSLSGKRLYDYEPPDGIGPIDDCYAMSASGEVIWTCYYSDFPLVQVSETFTVSGRSSGVAGAHTIAGGTNNVAIVGGYGGQHHHITTFDVRASAPDNAEASRIVMPDGSPLPSDALIVARDRYVNVLTRDQWLRIDVDELTTP